MTTAPASLLDRAGLDRAAARRHLAHGLEGADDGELFLEYKPVGWVEPLRTPSLCFRGD